MHGQPLVGFVHLERGDDGVPIVAVAEAPRCRFDVDPAAPDRLLLGCRGNHAGLVVGGLDPRRIAESGLMINTQPHLNASLRGSRPAAPRRQSSSWRPQWSLGP